jgi:uncharacterized membrane protein YqaE (UPF0057 family)
MKNKEDLIFKIPLTSIAILFPIVAVGVLADGLGLDNIANICYTILYVTFSIALILLFTAAMYILWKN